MSLILDALRKSERTRQQSLTGQLGVGETPPPPARLALPWTTLLGILLVVNALVLAVFFWRSNNDNTAEPKAVAAPVAAYHPEVRPLSEEVQATTEATPVLPPQASPVTTPAPAAPAAAPATPQDAGTLPTFDSLPADLRQSLPALHLDVLGYAAQAADRFVVINLQRYRSGDSLPEGPRVVDILPQGVVLEFNGTRFLLPP